MNQTKPQNFEILISPVMAVVELILSLKRSFGSLPSLRSDPCRPLQKPESWLHAFALFTVYVHFVCGVRVPVRLSVISATEYTM